MADRLALADEAEVTVDSATPRTETDETKTKRLADEKVLKLARKRLKSYLDGSAHFRTNAIDDMKFRVGTWGKKSFQWPEGIQGEREAAGRVCLTINRVPEAIRQVTNQARAAHLAITVSPVDDKGDPKAADVLAGIIRNIENNSMADRAYSMGSDKQAEQGLGYFELVTEWATDDLDTAKGADLFRQRIKIKRVRNPLTICRDLSAESMDFSDADWGMKFQDLDAEEYEALTGRKAPTTSQIAATFTAPGDDSGEWFPHGKVRYVKYVSRENVGEPVSKSLLSNGDVINTPDAEQEARLKAMDITVVRTRAVQKKQMVMRNLDALHVDETTIWPADGLPWIPVIGEECLIDGELDYRGIVRDMKDPARVYNVEVSSLTEMVGQGPKSSVIVYKGQVGKEGSPQRRAWEEAHLKPHPFLEINVVDVDGKPAPWIGRQNFELPLEGTVRALEQADNDLKTTSGFRDASLGERGPQESGKAIQARQRQDELGSSHYLDNLRFALAAAGRQLIQLIRVIYDTATVIRITGLDDRQRKVLVFSGAKNDPRNDPAYQLPDGVKEAYDIGTGEFDVIVNAGPQPGTRRQEALDAVTQIFKGLPPEISVKFLDLYFMLMDFSEARQMAERAKKMLPPELQDDEEGGMPIPPQVKQKMIEMEQKFKELLQAYQQAQDDLKSDRLKTESNERIKTAEFTFKDHQAKRQQQIDLIKTEATIDSNRAIAMIKAEMEALNQDLEREHEARLQAESHVHEAATAHADRLHEAGKEGFGAATEMHRQADDQAHQTAEAAKTRDHAILAAEQGNVHTLQQIDAQPKPAAGGSDDGEA